MTSIAQIERAGWSPRKHEMRMQELISQFSIHLFLYIIVAE